QEVEFLLEDAVELFAERLIEIGHLPAAELEALGWILGRPAGRLHDAIHGNHGADDNLPHGSLSLLNALLLSVSAWPSRPGDRADNAGFRPTRRTSRLSHRSEDYVARDAPPPFATPFR